MSQIYIIISIVALVVIALLVFFVGKGRQENRLNPLASLAFGFVIAGIVFGEERLLGYGLMGIGVVLSVVDIIMRSNRS
jgi:hypothetical protein